MRLINTKTLALKEFFSDQAPPYAILSHTWHQEEVSFQEWADQSLASQKKGYKKIFDTCQLAQKRGYDYLWVDTNCIDKSSSAELSEAINSMFKWYKAAQVCYVYLQDVPSNTAIDFPLRFRNSRWFTRGWTLQELLAPRDVEFYSADWSFLGTKQTLRSEISSITGIKIRYLWSKHTGDLYFVNSDQGIIARSIEYVVPLTKASVGERFSWLSDRTTTRLEDMAYCMLGIFELNMPLLYGEGSKALTRLQEEIMKVSDDHSLFCWTWNTLQNRGGFLSDVPSEFLYADRFLPKKDNQRPAPYTFTNAGLNIQLPVLHGWKSSFICLLRVDSVDTGKIVGLPMSGDLKTGRVYRKSFPPEPFPLCVGVSGSQDFSLFISEKYSPQYSLLSNHSLPAKSARKRRTRFQGFAVLLTFASQDLVRRIKTYPPDRFNPTQNTISIFFSKHSGKRELGSVLSWINGAAIRFIDSEHTYEGVLIQLELPSGEFRSFMIASMIRDDTEAGWQWHYWEVPSEDATAILSEDLEESSPVVERVHKAIKDPNYAHTLDSQVDKPHMSISIAEEYFIVDDDAISHMHVAL
jgi:hypothetical protein